MSPPDNFFEITEDEMAEDRTDTDMYRSTIALNVHFNDRSEGPNFSSPAKVFE